MAKKRPWKRPKVRQVGSFYCSDCNGWRAHQIQMVKDPATGNVSRVKVCSVCDLKGPLPGIQCPKCGRSRFTVLYVRHPRPGLTIRVKRCWYHDVRIRTVERLAGGQAE
jgi:hypothetical protein